MSTDLQNAIDAVKQGAEKALTYFGNNPSVTIKPDHTPVTQADKEAEAIIKTVLLSHYPHANFIGEETGGNRDVKQAWIIDPIDGTKNFMRGIENWAVLLAHYTDGVCDIGVSYIPVLEQLCYAQRGEGAFINGKKIHVSSITTLEDAFLSHGEIRYFEHINPLLLLAKRSLTQRCHGDASTYNNLAAGKIDIVIDAKDNVWDSAAFSVIIEEAGGKVSNIKGDPWNVNSSSFVATNGLLHAEVIEILNAKQ
jgi:histidinol-phosphatase